MQLIIDTKSTRLGIKNQSFFIEKEEVSRMISPKRVSSIAITSNCQLSASAIKLAARNKIPILFFNNTGKLEAKTWSPYFTNLAEIRRKQLLFSDTPEALEWVKYLLNKKATLLLVVLGRLVERKPSLNSLVRETTERITNTMGKIASLKPTDINECRGSLMGWEGSISSAYFQALQRFLPEEFKSAKRTRRPAKDAFNAALNYAYGMTYSTVENGVFAAGLDPFIGYLHVEGYVRRSLVFDLIEPYRPLIDQLLIRLFKEGELNKNSFTENTQGVVLNKVGKRILIPAYNHYLQQSMVVMDKRSRLKDHIFAESQYLVKLLK